MSRKGIFLALSRPKSPEDDAAYNKWYDEHHVPDSLLMPGFVKGRRFKLATEQLQLLPHRATEPGFEYVTIYELDDIDRMPEAREILPKLEEISGEWRSPGLDHESVRAFIFELISDIDEPTAIPEGVQLPSRD
jgi:hypothetical protein